MSIDIVNLVETNPITRFVGDYQSKLVEKVQTHFTNYEQQLFLASFYCYLKYNFKTDYIIDLDNIWGWLGFSQKVNAKKVLTTNFMLDIDYKCLLCNSQEQNSNIQSLLMRTNEQTFDTRGGHNKEKIMLNVETFKKLCLKARTKKADEVHEYFIKLEAILFELMQEECEQLKLQLMQSEANATTIAIKSKELEREKLLLEKFSLSASLIYIIRVKNLEDGSYIIKIGESRRGIKARYVECKNKHPDSVLLNCYHVNDSKGLESFLHHEKTIRANKVTNLPGHEKENELFLIGKTLTYQMVISIIDNNINQFNYTVDALLREIELLKELNEALSANQSSSASLMDTELDVSNVTTEQTALIASLQKENAELRNQNAVLRDQHAVLQDKIRILEIPKAQLVTGFNEQMPHLGPRLQQIHPESLTIVKVFECVTDAMNADKAIKRPSITKAVNENTVYCGFRWQLVERDLDPNIIHYLQPTRQTQQQNVGYIAKLNSSKTEILNVYLDKKTACRENGGLTASALDTPIKNDAPHHGVYYMLYDKCSDELKEAFEEKHTNGVSPLLYKNGVGQFDALLHTMVREFGCKYDCIRELKMSDKTLARSLENKTVYNGYYYQELGAKLWI